MVVKGIGPHFATSLNIRLIKKWALKTRKRFLRGVGGKVGLVCCKRMNFYYQFLSPYCRSCFPQKGSIMLDWLLQALSLSRQWGKENHKHLIKYESLESIHVLLTVPYVSRIFPNGACDCLCFWCLSFFWFFWKLCRDKWEFFWVLNSCLLIEITGLDDFVFRRFQFVRLFRKEFSSQLQPFQHSVKTSVNTFCLTLTYNFIVQSFSRVFFFLYKRQAEKPCHCGVFL